jgi:hypothetical protein
MSGKRENELAVGLSISFKIEAFTLKTNTDEDKRLFVGKESAERSLKI